MEQLSRTELEALAAATHAALDRCTTGAEALTPAKKARDFTCEWWPPD